MLLKKFFLNIIRRFDNLIYDNFGPTRIIFLVRNQLGWQCLLPILKKLIDRPGIKIAVTVEFEGCFNFPKEEEEARLFNKFYIKPNKAVYMKWHQIVMSNQTGLYFKRNAVHIFTHHGCGFGNLDASADAIHVGEPYEIKMLSEKIFNIIFCNSYQEYQNIYCEKPSLTECRNMQFFISGLARMDQLILSSPDQGERYLTDIGLDPDKKTVVVGSHWQSKSLLKSLGHKLIEDLCNMGTDYNILVMGHGRLWEDEKSNPDNQELFQTLTNMCDLFPQLRFFPHIGDTTGLFRSADVFLCDNSSTFLEYCTMDKPILLFDNPDFSFKKQLNEDRFKLAAFCFNGQSDVVSIVGEALDNPDLHKEERQKTVDFFLSNKGKSSQYIADTLVEMGRICGPESSGWQKVIAMSEKSLAKFDLHSFDSESR